MAAKPLPTLLGELGFKKRLKKDTGLEDTKVRCVGSIIGACMAVRRDAIEQVGLLDSDFFFYYEDTEWCHRFQQHGWQILFDPRIIVKHEKGASTRPFTLAKDLELFRSRLIYYRKVFSLPIATILILFRLLSLGVNLVFALLETILTVGLSRNGKKRLKRYSFSLAWLLFGMPRSWGLPGKCDSDEVTKG